MLNPFFSQGSITEQGLVQDLINEQLKMYGVECQYIPRKLVTKRSVIEEIIQSKFEQAFPLEGYVSTYDGFGGRGDLLTKFGVRTTDELTLVISKERFELSITPFLRSDPTYTLSSSPNRPKEGDLIYFPLSKNLFEIKYVEFEKPFYQLNKLYVYELRCELFEYEDEIIDTSIDEIDETIKNVGYTMRLSLSGVGSTASAITTRIENAVRKVFVNNDGYGYTTAPTISFSKPSVGTTATAIAVMQSIVGVNTGSSIDRILLTNPGSGYIGIPTVFVSGPGLATAAISTGAIGIVTITSGGSGYTTTPTVTFSSPPSGGVVATGEAVISSAGTVTAIRISDAGVGYTEAPTITIGAATTVGVGTYVFNEIVTVGTSNSARVKNWNSADMTLDIAVSDTLKFTPGQIVTGQESGAIYAIKSINTFSVNEEYDDNDVIEEEGRAILDFSEKNPFGDF